MPRGVPLPPWSEYLGLFWPSMFSPQLEWVGILVGVWLLWYRSVSGQESARVCLWDIVRVVNNYFPCTEAVRYKTNRHGIGRSCLQAPSRVMD